MAFTLSYSQLVKHQWEILKWHVRQCSLSNHQFSCTIVTTEGWVFNRKCLIIPNCKERMCSWLSWMKVVLCPKPRQQVLLALPTNCMQSHGYCKYLLGVKRIRLRENHYFLSTNVSLLWYKRKTQMSDTNQCLGCSVTFGARRKSCNGDFPPNHLMWTH